MATLGELTVRVGANISGFTSKMSQVRSSTKRTNDMMRKTGKNMTKFVTLPVLAAGAASVKAFADFDSAMTQSLAIMGDVSDAMRKDMASAAKEVSRVTTISSKQAAESYFFLASAGLDAEQSIAALPQVARFAQAGMFDMARATDLATDAQSALGLASDDAQENLKNLTDVTDVLVKANTLANASVEQFAEALTNRAAAAARQVGKDVEEVTAVLAAMADQGVKGQLAGNQLAIVLRNLQDAAINNRAEMAKLGVRVFDAAGNMENMADILSGLEDSMEGATDEQKKLTLAQLGFNDRAQSTLLTLIGVSDKVREYEEGLRDAGGTTGEVADNQMESLTSQFKLLRNAVERAAQSFGETLAPEVSSVTERLIGMADAVSELDAATLKAITTSAGFAATLGPIALFAAVVGVKGAAAVAAISAIAGAMSLAADAGNEFNEEMENTLAGISEPVGETGLERYFNRILGRFKPVQIGMSETKRAALELNKALADAGFNAMPGSGLANQAAMMGLAGRAGDPDPTTSGGGGGGRGGEQIDPRISELAKRGPQMLGFVKERVFELNEETGRFEASWRMANNAMDVSGAKLQQTVAPAISLVNEKAQLFQATMGAAGQIMSEELVNIGSVAIGDLVSGFESLEGVLQNVKRAVQLLVSDLIAAVVRAAALKAIATAFGVGAGQGASFSSLVLGGFRAHGGPVLANTPYIVGENGPELHVPNSSGRIIPNGGMTSSPQPVPYVANARISMGEIVFAIDRQLRSQGRPGIL